MATSCKELTHWKRLWCWEGLGAGGKGDNRGWDGWMASPTRWMWVWVNSGNWWWIGRPDVLWFIGLQRVGHNWATELNWTKLVETVYYKMMLCLLGLFMSNYLRRKHDKWLALLWVTVIYAFRDLYIESKYFLACHFLSSSNSITIGGVDLTQTPQFYFSECLFSNT